MSSTLARHSIGKFRAIVMKDQYHRAVMGPEPCSNIPTNLAEPAGLRR